MPSSVARYEILLPPMPGLVDAVMTYAGQQLKITYAHVEQRSVYQDGQPHPYNAVIFDCQDNPQSDSTMKHIAVQVGETTNVETVLVSKHAQGGIQSWPIRNPAFQSALNPGQTSQSPAPSAGPQDSASSQVQIPPTFA